MIFLVFPQAQNCVRFSQVFNVDNDPQSLIRQQAPNSELSAVRSKSSCRSGLKRKQARTHALLIIAKRQKSHYSLIRTLIWMTANLGF